MGLYESDNSRLSLLRAVLRLAADAVVTVAIAWMVVFAFGGSVTNTGQSMQPVLDNDETVLVDRLGYQLGEVRRYDIIVFDPRGSAGRETGKVLRPGTAAAALRPLLRSPGIQASGELSVKRVIGLPGETVLIEGGRVLINGEEPQGREELLQVDLPGLAASPVLLGEDEYFVLGDNRGASEDSRFGSIGSIKKEQILGRAWVRCLPLSKFSFIRRDGE